MTVTRLGPDLPKLTSGLSGTSQVPPSGGSGQVVTANGSNGVYWGENVARITANGSNTVLGPFVNFAAGTNVSLSVASNTMTIASTGGGGGGDLPWFDVTTDGTCVGDGVTDDTAALQSAIDTATASGTQSATLYFPPGTYLIGGALQDTGAFNGQILLPDVDLADPQITIRFLGANRPPLAIHGGDPPDSAGYATIRSTLTGAAGTASVISGGNGPYSTYQNNLQVIWENLILVVPSNPTLSGLNLEACQGGVVRDNWFCDAGAWYSGTHAEPTHSNSYGYKLPGKRNSWYTVAEGNGSCGFYTGFLCGELTVSNGGLGAAFSIYAVEMPEVEHLTVIQEFGFTACTYGIRVTGAHPFCITAMDMQHDPSPAWAVTVADLYDPSDLGYGDIGWWSGNMVLDHTFTKDGGANVHIHELGDYPEGYPVGPAGGELGGDYPNPTVATTHSGSTHSSIQSAAEATAAAALAAHIASSSITGIGPLLLSDDHAGPIVFDDILQADDYADFLYADTI